MNLPGNFLSRTFQEPSYPGTFQEPSAPGTFQEPSGPGTFRNLPVHEPSGTFQNLRVTPKYLRSAEVAYKATSATRPQHSQLQRDQDPEIPDPDPTRGSHAP